MPDRRWTEQRLWRCVSQIPGSCRRIWRLHDFVGLGTREIARFLGVPGRLVRSRLRTARRTLRQALRVEFGPPAHLRRFLNGGAHHAE